MGAVVHMPGGRSVNIMVCRQCLEFPWRPCDWYFFPCLFRSCVYYGMYAARVLWSVGEGGRRSVSMTTGLLRGWDWWKGEGCECACVVEVYVHESVCVRWGWGKAEYYGLSVAR